MTTEECRTRLLELEASRHMYGDGAYIYDAVRLWTLQQWADWIGLGVVRQGSGNTCWFRTDWGSFPTRAEALEAAWKAETEVSNEGKH